MANEKIALITGANKGIGLETAKQLARRGYTALIGARKEKEGRAAAEAVGADAEYIAIDMSKPETFAAAAETIGAKYGRLDVLVNNAGISPDAGMAPSAAPIAAVRQTFETNVFGLIELTQTLLPLLRKSEAGRIVNVSSVLGSLSLNANFEANLGEWRSFGYNGSKAAVNMFTVLLAYELRQTKIKVNSAHPGWVKTELGGEHAPLEVAEGAETSVYLATLPDNGPTGGYFHKKERLAW
jgi:NAD(P)-dependent dehydrogenase (short-subunit alcohol dehydrogenase family)